LFKIIQKRILDALHISFAEYIFGKAFLLIYAAFV